SPVPARTDECLRHDERMPYAQHLASVGSFALLPELVAQTREEQHPGRYVLTARQGVEHLERTELQPARAEHRCDACAPELRKACTWKRARLGEQPAVRHDHSLPQRLEQLACETDSGEQAT